MNSLQLGVKERLHGRFSRDEIARCTSNEPLPKLWRTRLQQKYVQYVMGRYTERFGNSHVGVDIVQHVSQVMTSLYPSLRDEDSSADNPNFVSRNLWDSARARKQHSTCTMQYLTGLPRNTWIKFGSFCPHWNRSPLTGHPVGRGAQLLCRQNRSNLI